MHLAAVVIEGDADVQPSKWGFMGLTVCSRKWHPMFVQKRTFKCSSWNFSRALENNGASGTENLPTEFRISQAV